MMTINNSLKKSCAKPEAISFTVHDGKYANVYMQKICKSIRNLGLNQTSNYFAQTLNFSKQFITTKIIRPNLNRTQHFL